ncbi:M20 family metallopeptidase [Pseudonocardia abyssalis]|uniref:Peptidase M20 domain-containing protein 2 n=1 Tax=Pseudonocardia abyssalis TaxID=2792008 RepID=A0ABS6UXV1_9PSEU|nr:M20 family metallopeptidase [Pseudonocardia abyssalis]MBW0115855.1 M20 family metallopeptidase [Pseudonocardia abyssalis]MBW0136811.1 M20 family metallopeptidase [Pseudonocardia abyssalis]
MTEPLRPDDGYLRSLDAATARAAESAEPLTSPHAGASDAVRRRVTEAVAGCGDQLVRLSRDLHAHPEVGFDEHRSVQAVADLLASHGHEARIGAGGLDTAFVARVGTDGPHVAVLAEYDALPGVGHACGHNIICSTAVGGFLAAAKVVGETGGRLSLIGTPAEEGGGGKETLARAGVFDDVDAVVMLHPFSHDVAMHPFLGRRQLEMVFHGVAAHAAAQPFMGRNALDAAVAAYQGVAALRQHLPGTDRAHGVFTDGGARPNVVPERAALMFYLRSAAPETLRDLAERVSAVAHGAAAMHGCGVELLWDAQPAYLPIRFNHALSARWAVNQEPAGRTPLPPGVVPEFLTGSTDLGNLSFRMPAIHPMLAVADAALHTAEFATAAGSPAGDRAVRDGALGLALTAADYLADADLRDAVHAEFAELGGPLDVPGYFA